MRGAPRALRARPEIVPAVVLFAVLLGFAGEHGWYRDELYFIVAGRRPAWGYPDQPMLVPLIAAHLYDLGGGRLIVVRAVAALAAAAAVLLVGALAGLVGGPCARLVAASTWAVSGAALVTGHALVTGTLDMLLAIAVAYCAARAARGDGPHWIGAAGLALGIGLTNKLLIGGWAACLLAAYLIVGPRRQLRSGWTAAGAAVALLGAAPYLFWQHAHGWPQLAMMRVLSTDRGFWVILSEQVTGLNIAIAPLALAGLAYLLIAPAARPLRAPTLAYLLLLALVVITDGRGHYTTGGLSVAAVGAGLLAERLIVGPAPGRLPAPPRLAPVAVAVVGVMIALSAAIGARYSLPTVPVRELGRTDVPAVNSMISDEVGWPEVARATAAVRDLLPADRRADAVVFTANFATAAAVELYGPRWGLSRVYSGHNGYAQWGPPGGNGPVILVGFDTAPVVARYFRGCRRAGRMDNGVGLANSEQGGLILLCDGPAAPWPRLWPGLVHYDLGPVGSEGAATLDPRGPALSAARSLATAAAV